MTNNKLTTDIAIFILIMNVRIISDIFGSFMLNYATYRLRFTVLVCTG